MLAAGLGSRLQSVHNARPKGFLEIGGMPIIARSVEALRRAGVSEFVFVVGWRGEIYRDWCAQKCSGAVCVENAEYATTGSLRSLLLGAAAVPERNLIVVESDLLYEQRAPDLLLAVSEMDTVLVSGFTRSRDEVWAYESAPNLLARLTKRRDEENVEPVGELVGLTRMSASLIRDLGTAAQTMPGTVHYEDGLNALAASRPITLLPVPDLAWCEIDDPAHLARARHAVWPRTVTADTAWNLKP
ncbi:MAG: phosphocholine cytidylyltransferase family protein [Undibacterium sp.]|nr:phosphocholine cytidylyltransferase family protein [Opitutaceae bacterium]